MLPFLKYNHLKIINSYVFTTAVKVEDKPVRLGFMVRDASDCPEKKSILVTALRSTVGNEMRIRGCITGSSSALRNFCLVSSHCLSRS